MNAVLPEHATEPTQIVAPNEWLAAVLDHHRPNHLPDTHWTQRLPRFQRDAAVRLLDLLERHLGAILCDDVGLGKTHVADAVVRSRPDWRPALVVGPAAVMPAWRHRLDRVAGLRFCSFSRLSRGQVPTEGPFGLIVVDEAHRLRNPATKRYARLARLALESRLLLVTATPVHNSTRDIMSLLGLFSARLPTAGTNALRDEVARVLVRRTRWTVTQIYGREHRVVGVTDLSFPRRRVRTVRTALGPRLERLVEDLPAMLRAAFPECDTENTLGLMGTLLLQRLESSPAALIGTLRRCRNYLIRAREAAAQGQHLPRSQFRALFGTDPQGQVAQLLLPFFFDGLAAARLFDTAEAVRSLERFVECLEGLPPEEDAKLSALLGLLESEPDRPVLVMTTYEDTARYLFGRLGVDSVLLTGRGAWSRRHGRISREEALRGFAPTSQGASFSTGGARFQIMVTTDVLSEGVNLQDARRLIHYDRPWNPMAVEQRTGRIDRLNSPHDEVEVITFEVSRPVERRLGLERRLAAKLGVRRAVLSTRSQDGIPFGEGDAKTGADDADRIGLDRDGFLMACAARVGLGVHDVPVAAYWPTGGPGWIVALECAGELAVIAVGEASGSSYEVLAQIAQSVHTTAMEPRGVLEPPPAHLLTQALERFWQRLESGFWAGVEPALAPRSRRRLRQAARELWQVTTDAYRFGDLNHVTMQGVAFERLRRLGAGTVAHVDPRDLVSPRSRATPVRAEPISNRLPLDPPENGRVPSTRNMGSTAPGPIRLLGWLQILGKAAQHERAGR